MLFRSPEYIAGAATAGSDGGVASAGEPAGGRAGAVAQTAAGAAGPQACHIGAFRLSMGWGAMVAPLLSLANIFYSSKLLETSVFSDLSQASIMYYRQTGELESYRNKEWRPMDRSIDKIQIKTNYWP